MQTINITHSNVTITPIQNGGGSISKSASRLANFAFTSHGTIG